MFMVVFKIKLPGGPQSQDLGEAKCTKPIPNKEKCGEYFKDSTFVGLFDLGFIEVVRV
jgi:hypothetical protein